MELKLGHETLEERKQNDQLTHLLVSGLIDEGILPQGSYFDAVRFRQLQQQMDRTFVVPESSITTLMARLLFALGQNYNPNSVLFIGSAYGNALSWLTGGLDLQQTTVIGMDTDPQMIRSAKDNFARSGITSIQFHCLDGHLARQVVHKPIELLFLDADDPQTGKQIYHSLLLQLEELLQPGAMILAHDISYPNFQSDLEKYKERVADIQLFKLTRTLDIDPYGLEVTIR